MIHGESTLSEMPQSGHTALRHSWSGHTLHALGIIFDGLSLIVHFMLCPVGVECSSNLFPGLGTIQVLLHVRSQLAAMVAGKVSDSFKGQALVDVFLQADVEGIGRREGNVVEGINHSALIDHCIISFRCENQPVQEHQSSLLLVFRGILLVHNDVLGCLSEQLALCAGADGHD